jgi:Holliday junction DNA helicase RuvA
MIEALRGILRRSEDDFAVLDVHGVLFKAEIPASSASQLPPTGEQAQLFTRLSLNVNEGNFQLFGFFTETERDCFDILTGISGIGPKKGLMILSQIEVGTFAQAIVREDLTYLSKIKGIGRKTAERLVVELREKMVPYTKAVESGEAKGTALPQVARVRDAVDALIVLGCRPAVAEKAIGIALQELGEEAPTEALVRVGLRHR